MITCSKTFADIPLAHRQHAHPGPCRFIHGHSWSIRVTFACEQLNEHGFVVDFGKLGYLQTWIDEHLDHGIMLANDDAAAKKLIDAEPGLFKVFWVDQPSCEGLAEVLFETFNGLLKQHERGRAWVTSVEVWEDPRNMTRYTADTSGR